jgi:hypothetical protein
MPFSSKPKSTHTRRLKLTARDPLQRMLPGMLTPFDQFQIGQFVIGPVTVFVVNVKPFRDWTAIVFPTRTMQIGYTLAPVLCAIVAPRQSILPPLKRNEFSHADASVITEA